MFVLTAAFIAASLLYIPPVASAEQVSVEVTIQPSLSLTRLGDSLLVRSNAPWVLTIECEDPDCGLPHVYTRPSEHGQVIVHLHGEGYSICMK